MLLGQESTTRNNLLIYNMLRTCYILHLERTKKSHPQDVCLRDEICILAVPP